MYHGLYRSWFWWKTARKYNKQIVHKWIISELKSHGVTKDSYLIWINSGSLVVALLAKYPNKGQTNDVILKHTYCDITNIPCAS